MNGDRISELFDSYVASYRAGDGDPQPFTEQLEGADRLELQSLIEMFLDRVPDIDFNESDYADSVSARVAQEVAASLAGPSGQLPVLLAGLRRRLQIKVERVNRELAEELGATDEHEQAQVADYYHQLEYGTLPARPVSDRVFDALGRIYKVPAAKLRAAGEALGPQHDHLGGPVYARVAGSLADKGQAAPGLYPMESKKQFIEDMREKKRSRIDDLFLGESG